VLLSVLGCEREDGEDHLPTRFDETGLLVAERCHAHDDVLLDFAVWRVQVVVHNGFKGFQEHFLVAEVFALLLLKEFVSKLAQGVKSIHNYVQVLVSSNPGEMFAEGPPDALPLEPNSVHIKRCNFYKFLKAELLWAVFICKLVS